MQQTGKKIRSWYLCCFLFSWILLYNLRPWYSNFEWWICLVYFTIVEFIRKKVLWRWRNTGSQCCLLKMRVLSPSLLILRLSFQVLFMPFWQCLKSSKFQSTLPLFVTWINMKLKTFICFVLFIKICKFFWNTKI